MLDFPLRRRFGKAIAGLPDFRRLHDLSARFWLGYNIANGWENAFIADCLGLRAGRAKLPGDLAATTIEDSG